MRGCRLVFARASFQLLMSGKEHVFLLTHRLQAYRIIGRLSARSLRGIDVELLVAGPICFGIKGLVTEETTSGDPNRKTQMKNPETWPRGVIAESAPNSSSTSVLTAIPGGLVASVCETTRRRKHQKNHRAKTIGPSSLELSWERHCDGQQICDDQLSSSCKPKTRIKHRGYLKKYFGRLPATSFSFIGFCATFSTRLSCTRV